MDVQLLERLSSELIRLCDNIEKHGLVDYQMGVAEEEIMERKYLLYCDAFPRENSFLTLTIVLLPCISLLNSANQRTNEGAGPNEASAAGASRPR